MRAALWLNYSWIHLTFKTSELHPPYSLCYQQWQTTNGTQDNWLWHRALLIWQLRSLLCRAPDLTPPTWTGSGSIPSCLIFLNPGPHWSVTQGLQFHKSVLIPSTHGWLIPSANLLQCTLYLKSMLLHHLAYLPSTSYGFVVLRFIKGPPLQPHSKS